MHSYSASPFIEISLPPAYILPKPALISLYISLAIFDLILLRYQHVVSPKAVRWCMVVIHILVPMIVISDNPPLNVLIAATPWFLATYTASMPSSENLTLIGWIKALLQIVIDREVEPKSDTLIRLGGLKKMALGIMKVSFLHLAVDPMLPEYTQEALAYPWTHPMSMFYTILFGVKGYCMLGVVDFFIGVEQTLFAWNLVSLFHSPILASSPRDFWSRRWNRIVRNLLHAHVFSNKAKTTKVQHSPRPSFWSTRQGRGLLTFVISGVFHELIIMSACRKLTLENFMFFTLQGIAVMIEVELRQGALKQQPRGKTRIMCIAAQLLFMSVSGRLFNGPFLRYDFFS
ncbi:hypothetical protein EDC96DRAFT_515355 [Choanephora cucurbitarum]|nr:hypothetical protein EDC96DRAFT_515355 [Choanephora cucurbitarum]